MSSLPPAAPTADRFERIASLPAYLQVAEAIEAEIVSGRIRPGEPIGTEAALVAQFGVDRKTVREGIRCLEQSGLLCRGPGRRLIASLPHYNKLATRISRAFVLHQVSIREAYEAIDVLERNAVELAVAHRTDADLDALADNVARTRAALDDFDLLPTLDTEFHALIGRATDNRVFQLSREPAGLLIYSTTKVIFEHVPEAASRLLVAHEHLLDALHKRDLEAARQWIRRHVADFGKGLKRTGRSFDAPVDPLPGDFLS